MQIASLKTWKFEMKLRVLVVVAVRIGEGIEKTTCSERNSSGLYVQSGTGNGGDVGSRDSAIAGS